MNEKRACCETTSACCKEKRQGENSKDYSHIIIDNIQTQFGNVPRVSSTLSIQDTLGTWKARWGINRMNYRVSPGLYCVGNAEATSPVIVIANYKMSFDALRRELKGFDAWILVLDTHGINVWCAAGKGTFGTQELVNKIETTYLAKIVSHRTIILPQLGAPGVAAHEVQKQSGFRVVYGPVRASDLPAFLLAGNKATPEMRRVKFTLYNRLVLTPIELVGTIKPVAIIGSVLVLLSMIGIDMLSVSKLYPYFGAILVGCVIVPVLLPWIPGSAFTWKGWLAGVVWVMVVGMINSIYLPALYTWKQMLIYFLITPALSSYLALNFTGCSTFTSMSGVLKEMKIALPMLAISLAFGLVLMMESLINY